MPVVSDKVLPLLEASGCVGLVKPAERVRKLPLALLSQTDLLMGKLCAQGSQSRNGLSQCRVGAVNGLSLLVLLFSKFLKPFVDRL